MYLRGSACVSACVCRVCKQVRLYIKRAGLVSVSILKIGEGGVSFFPSSVECM